MKRSSSGLLRQGQSRWDLGCALVVLCWLVGASSYPQHANAQQADSQQRFQPSSFESTALDSEEQLRQLKQAFLTLAMDQEAQVAASGWTDSNGTMGEDVMVFSGLKLEKLRPVLRKNRFGMESASLTLAPDLAGETCGDQPTRPQRLGLSVVVAPLSRADTQNMAGRAARLIRHSLQGAFAEGRLTSVSTIVDARTTNYEGMSAYRRYMTAAPASTVDLQLLIEIGAVDDKPLMHRLGVREHVRSNKILKVRMSLRAKSGLVASLDEEILMESNRQSATNQMAWLQLPEPAENKLQAWLLASLSDVDAVIPCHAESALALVTNPGQVQVLGGRDAGVYVGQRMAILPKSQTLRTRGLQQSLGVVGLAQVTSVGPRTASLEIYAGPSYSDMADMMAMPVSALAL